MCANKWQWTGAKNKTEMSQLLHVLQVALQTNTELLQLPDKYEASDSAAILAQVSADLNSPAESTRLEALHWVSALPPCHSPQLLMLFHQHLVEEDALFAATFVYQRH